MLMTFVSGVFVGVYAFFVGYSPAASTVENSVGELVDNVTIVGEAYGGCDRVNVCPTFRVAADGSYRYFYTPGPGAAEVLREGQLPVILRRNLYSLLEPSILAPASQPTEPALCASYTDGIDVRYTVTRNGERYVLDSCGTAVDGESDLWQTLSRIWTRLEADS